VTKAQKNALDGADRAERTPSLADEAETAAGQQQQQLSLVYFGTLFWFKASQVMTA
jgi:hypothetical protein